MNAGVHHPNYRVIPAGFARGYFYAICKVCEAGNQYQSAKGSVLSAEKAVIAHLKGKHNIEETA